jgi:hypothetical protein
MPGGVLRGADTAPTRTGRLIARLIGPPRTRAEVGWAETYGHACGVADWSRSHRTTCTARTTTTRRCSRAWSVLD